GEVHAPGNQARAEQLAPLRQYGLVIVAAQLPRGVVEDGALLESASGSGLRLLFLYFLKQHLPNGRLYWLWRHSLIPSRNLSALAGILAQCRPSVEHADT